MKSLIYVNLLDFLSISLESLILLAGYPTAQSSQQPTNRHIIQSFEESGLNKTDGIRHSLIEVPKPEKSVCLISHLDLFKNRKIHPRVT